jgi:hypothetical protein
MSTVIVFGPERYEALTRFVNVERDFKKDSKFYGVNFLRSDNGLFDYVVDEDILSQYERRIGNKSSLFFNDCVGFYDSREMMMLNAQSRMREIDIFVGIEDLDKLNSRARRSADILMRTYVTQKGVMIALVDVRCAQRRTMCIKNYKC